MIEKIDIKNASIVEAVRSQMATATEAEKGLMSPADYKFTSSVVLDNPSEIPYKIFRITQLTGKGFTGIIEFYGVRVQNELPSSIRLYIENSQSAVGSGTYMCYRQGSELLKIYKDSASIYLMGDSSWAFLSARILGKANSNLILQDVTGVIDISSLTEVVYVE